MGVVHDLEGSAQDYIHPWTFKWWPVAEIGRAEALATQKAGCGNGPEEDPRRAEV